MIYENIQNLITIAAFSTSFKFYPYAIMNNGDVIYVEDAELIRIISQVFQASHKIILSPHNTPGMKLHDGNWTGLLGIIERSEADLAVGGIALTEERFENFNFSYPYDIVDVTFLTKYPKPAPLKIILDSPFSFTLWIAIAICVLSVSFVLFILTKRAESYKNILFKIFCNLLEKSIGFKRRIKNVRILLGVWLLSAFVITNGYKSVLQAFHSVPPVEGIRDISDLVKAAEKNSVS